MSFYSFNQLYGQWHHMSQAALRLHGKDGAPKKTEDTVTVGKTPKELETFQAKEEIKRQNQDKEFSDSDIAKVMVREKNSLPLESDFQAHEIVQKQSESESESIEPDCQENLPDIEYLHLSSQNLLLLEERLHYSPYARRKFRLWKETMGMCVYCGKHINALDYVNGVNSDVEHIIPKAVGGMSTLDNLVCSCRKCNGAKGDMTALDYVLTLNTRQQSNFFNRCRLLVSAGAMSEKNTIIYCVRVG